MIHSAAIGKVQDQIAICEKREMSLDDMEGESLFTKLPKLKNTVVKLWKRREALMNRSDFTGRKTFQSFSYMGTGNLDVDKLVQDYYYKLLNLFKSNENKFFEPKNQKRKSKPMPRSAKSNNFAFFNIIDLKKYLVREIDEANINYILSDEMLLKIYKDLLEENKKRRLSDQFDSFRTLTMLSDLKPNSMVEENDPAFNKDMEEKLNNKSIDTSIAIFTKQKN